MSKLPVISGKECIKALEKVGFKIARQRGSHIVLVRENPKATVNDGKIQPEIASFWGVR